MKDFIVVMALMMLGVCIAVAIISDDDRSLKSSVGRFMERQAAALGS